MSVINKMLRDLDQRNHNAANVKPVIARRTGQPLWLTVLLLLTFGLLCFAIYAVLSRSSVVPVATTLTAEAQQLAEDLPKEPVISSGNALIAHSHEPGQSHEPERGPEPEKSPEPAVKSAPTGNFSATQGQAQLQQTNTAPAPATERFTPDDTATAGVALPMPSDTGLAGIGGQAEPQPGKPTAPVQAATVLLAPVPAANTASSLSVTSRAPTAAQQQAKLRQQALAAAQAGQPQQSLRYWQQLQQLAPQEAMVYLAQARLWLQLGQPQQAEASLLQAKAQGIMDADIQLMLAQAAASRQQWLQTEALLPDNFALALHPDYYGLKATALQQLGQHQQAADWFAQLSRLQPQQGKWWLGGAVSLDALARPAEAHQYYLNALQWGDGLSVQSKTYIQQRLAATE